MSRLGPVSCTPSTKEAWSGPYVSIVVFAVRDHTMKKMASIVLAGAALITCTNAWSWYMKGETVRFNDNEWSYCKAGAMDATSIMYSRQMGTPLEYLYKPYSDTHEKMRAQFIQMAKSYPIEATKEKKMAVTDKFNKDMQRGCLLYLKAVQPESFAE